MNCKSGARETHRLCVRHTHERRELRAGAQHSRERQQRVDARDHSRLEIWRARLTREQRVARVAHEHVVEAPGARRRCCRLAVRFGCRAIRLQLRYGQSDEASDIVAIGSRELDDALEQVVRHELEQQVERRVVAVVEAELEAEAEAEGVARVETVTKCCKLGASDLGVSSGVGGTVYVRVRVRAPSSAGVARWNLPTESANRSSRTTSSSRSRNETQHCRRRSCASDAQLSLSALEPELLYALTCCCCCCCCLSCVVARALSLQKA